MSRRRRKTAPRFQDKPEDCMWCQNKGATIPQDLGPYRGKIHAKCQRQALSWAKETAE